MTKTIDEAFLAAQSEFTKPRKDANNPHFRSKYATLASVQEACFPALHKHGFSVMHGVTEQGVTTSLRYGEESITVCIPVSDWPANPQHLGSLLTYMRRYGLLLITGLAPDDDDGNAATEHKPKPPKPDFKRIYGDIKNTTDLDRLMKIEQYVLDNAETSRDKLLELIEDQREAIAQADLDKSWE